MCTSGSSEMKPFAETAVWFVLGAATVATLQNAGGWWLNSGRGVVRMVLALAALGVFAGVRRFGGRWVRASALWAGAFSATAAILFRIGPGTIWPIVLAFAAAITAAAVFSGTFVGSRLARLRHQPPDRARNAR